jgi:GDP-L-fucose synthase
MNKSSKLYIAGHTGMVGSALMRKFTAEGFTNIITKTREELDLRNQQAVTHFFQTEKPEYVIIAAAKVGGILANNTYRAEFLYDNLMIQSNIIHASASSGVEKLIFLGSSCIYPRDCPQPIKEEYLLTGPLEQTNEPYAIAKIAGIKLCENYYKQYGCNFYSVMPTNLYGPNDNFDLETSHVLPALIRKFHEAKVNNAELVDKSTLSPVEVWGTGTPRREFLYVDDLADALFFLLSEVEARDIYEQRITHLNIGTGEDITIKELAEMIKEIIGFKGEIIYDSTKPDGTSRKLLDVSRINGLGWRSKIDLEEGIKKTYEWFLKYQ